MNFLQKGLAGLESRLDKVLLDEADRPAPRIAPVPEQRRASGETAMRRSGETGRLGMSMQERLAAAVAAKSGRSSPASRNSSRPPVAGEGGGGGGTSGRRGEETPPPVKKKEVEEKKEMEEAVAVAEVGEEARTEDALPPPIITNGKRESTEEPPDAAPADPIPADSTREELLELISQLREDLQVCETRRQGETHDASERIDALGEKLRYLSQSSASEARSRAVTTPGEKQLSERDEKIALLIEEGERLSKNELKLQTTIKKLRAMAKEGEDAKKRQERAEKLLADERDKVKKAYEAERRAGERIKALGRVQVELEALRSEKNALDGVVRELKEKLDEQTRRAEDAEGKVQTEALESERKNTIELRARMERVQGEAAMTEEKLKGEISNLKHKLERAAEKARIRELQIKGEQSVLESKIEALRARVEEASSGSTGDAHAKLLRQVETLQTQYAIASENWQGIEGSLLARVANLEKERDELSKKESDIRRKAREMNLRCKTYESDLEACQSKLKDLESDLMTAQELTSMLRTKLTTAETAASTTLRKERTSWERELQTRLQTEREKWEESTIPTTLTPAIAPSPPVVPYIPHRPSAASATESYFLGYSRRPPSRSPSVEPPRSSSGFRTPPVRQDSFPYYIGRADSFPQHQMHSRAENDHGEDADYTYFDTLSPSSPQRNTDMISVSTVAAGPSVQLVERMSAAVRRLESEMSGSREELARVVSQRDEARKEIVALMTEVGEKREACERVRRLEEQMEDGKVRLETTLEMLGEKSERVEELVQDVKDLKEMYRELVLSTSGGGR